APTPDPYRPAYLIYTSGSTGQPKGVVVPLRAVANFLGSMADTPGLSAGDRLLAVTTLAFDIAVLELLLPLTVGATTVIATDDQVRDPRQLMQLLDGAGITVMQATPALWRNLVTAGWQGSAGLRVLCGGEALDRDLAAQLRARSAQVWNLYGPTETTVWSCVERVGDEPGPVSIGRPIANTLCYVLDEQLQPVPIGARGELWIGGAGLALGYHARPALTAERFVPDTVRPHSPEPGRMYRTGDRARWRADGRLEVLGRTDFQLKLRGFRLEPGEIESTLLARPGVSAAVVVLREVAGDPRLVAYLVPGEQHEPEDGLLSALRQSLPAYMVPSGIVWLSSLPLTPNGKVDRAALPPPGARAGEATGADAATAAPRTAGEMALAAIVGELLGAPVGLDDDFFARGGHSLLATRLIARVDAELHATLPLRAVFETPTVRGLAARLPAASPAGAASAATRPEEISRLKPLLPDTDAPLSLVQQRLWFLDRLRPGNSAYNLAWAFELRGALDRPALQAALDQLAARHASLRTHIGERDGEPRQVIVAPSGLPLQAVTADPALAATVAGEFAARPFCLATGPLARALLVGSAPELHTLVLVVHHIVADGWSFGVLSRELPMLYAAALAGADVTRSAGLPPLPRDYASWAREQRRALAGGELARQLAWWQEHLRGAPPFLDLPTDRPRAALPSPRGARLSRTLPPELQSALAALARAEGCTLFMVLLAAFDVLLARQSGTEDVLVGTPIAGRPQADLEGLIGFFVNTLVLRTDLRGNPTVRELLARVRGMTLAAYEYAEVPFELLVETLQPPRSTSRTPLFQVLFNLHSEPGAPLELAGLEVRPVAIPRETAKFDLSVSLAETRAGLAVTIEYSTDLFLAESVERLLADYAVVLSGFVAAPAGRLTALPFSPGAGAPVPVVAMPAAARTLTDAFAGQVARQPQALAVSAPAVSGCPATDWSYAVLAAEAAAIGAALARQGVQPGDRVGLWFGQGAGQVAGMLGVLQAGAAWVPLDPLAPPARLERIIRDAGVRIVVTDASATDWPAALAGAGLVLLRREELPVAAGPVVQAAGPDALAYLIYTSGSTGTPKGVPQTHRNVLHFVSAWSRNLGLAADDRLSLLSTCGYDAAVQDIFGALLAGASVSPLDVRRTDRETLLDRIADRGLTVLHGTPTVYRYLFGGHVACRQDLSRVRQIVLGGEPARRADFDLFRARFRRGARFVNGYGLTEATAVTQWFADHDTLPRGQQLPIGRPLLPPADGQRVLLLDDAGAPAAIAGELVIESAHVTPGYWPAVVGAASAATRPPLETRGLDSSGGRVAAEAAPTPIRRFHTGDIARYLPDGNLVFVGRRDERVKIGGIRVEPGDIESALRGHPAIGEAVVLPREELPGETVLEAYFTTRDGEARPAPAALRSHLSTLLPAAFIPARFTPCDALPRLPNGKVDRQALAGAAFAATPLPLESSPRVSSGRGVAAKAAPTGEAADDVETALREIWQGLLRRDGVGLDEDFFLLGGHSLLATRLVARIRDRFGVELPLIRVFEAPTVRGLAVFLRPGGIQMPRPDDYPVGEQAFD
ncbi:MAG: amino acid adenylation domain-containing protein, partial [Gammaproteobacteria bacterium]